MESSNNEGGRIHLGRRSPSAGREILRWLDLHWLEHSPANYAFAYRVLFGDDDTLKREVDRITGGGVRITPAEVAMLGGADGEKTAPALNHLVLRLLDVIGGAASATGSFNRDLIGAATAIVGPNPVDLGALITAMIDRTAEAEAHLADATRQVRALRQELSALGGDATRDRLTGLLNQKGVEARLEAAAGAARGCAIALLGVDRLKSINGAHGHAIGDRVLRAIAEDLLDSCHPHLVARWDGDVFLVLLDGFTATAAADVIEVARARLAGRQLTVRETGAPLGLVSISAGVASSRGRSAAELLASAVALLQHAKSSGRNRVEAEPPIIAIE